jgi:membrane-associated phospholipid phosphatase
MISSLPYSLQKPVRIFSAALVILFLASLLIEKGQDVLLINGRHTPFVDWFFKSVTHLGDGAILIPCTIMLVFVRYKYALAGLAAALLNGMLVAFFKQVLFLGAPRPRGYLSPDTLHFVEGVSVYARNSFPSGHTASAFCFAFLVAYAFQNNRITFFMLTYALVVGYSRIYLAQHFLLDVAAGAIVGSFAAWAICMALEAAKIPTWMNQKLTRATGRKLTFP